MVGLEQVRAGIAVGASESEGACRTVLFSQEGHVGVPLWSRTPPRQLSPHLGTSITPIPGIPCSSPAHIPCSSPTHPPLPILSAPPHSRLFHLHTAAEDDAAPPPNHPHKPSPPFLYPPPPSPGSICPTLSYSICRG